MKKKIVIIGGGISGIASAIELISSGFEIILFERNPYLGGRASSHFDKLTETLIDNGQHVFIGAYKNFFELLEKLGTKHLLYTQPTLNIPFFDINGYYSKFDSSILPGKAGVVLGILNFKRISIKSKFYALKLFSRLFYDKLNYSGKTAWELLISEKQGEDLIRLFWRPLVLAAMNAQPERADATLLIEILSRAFLAGGKSSGLIFPACPLSELIKPFNDYITSSGSRIEYNTNISELIINDRKVIGVKTSEGNTIDCDSVISAIPPDSLYKIIPDNLKNEKYFSNLNQFEYSPIISVYLWFDKEINLKEPISALIGTKTHWVFNGNAILQKNYQSKNEKFKSQLALTISNAFELINLSKEQILEICLSELKKAFSEFNDMKVTHSIVIKERKATILVTPQIKSLRPTHQSPIENLFIAGDWTKTGLPATLESAALSGIKAAKLIMK